MYLQRGPFLTIARICNARRRYCSSVAANSFAACTDASWPLTYKRLHKFMPLSEVDANNCESSKNTLIEYFGNDWLQIFRWKGHPPPMISQISEALLHL